MTDPKMSIEELLAMPVHTTLSIHPVTEGGILMLHIVRVPNGWLYVRRGQPGTFVPEPITESVEIVQVDDRKPADILAGFAETVKAAVNAAVPSRVFSFDDMQKAWIAGNVANGNKESGREHFHDFMYNTYNIKL